MNITIKPIGRQAGKPEWGIGSLDLYNIDAPGHRCHGTTIAVPAGSPHAVAQAKAAETAEAWV